MKFDFKYVGTLNSDFEVKSKKYGACIYLLYDVKRKSYYGGATTSLENRMEAHRKKYYDREINVYLYYSNLNGDSIRKREDELLKFLKQNVPRPRILNRLLYSTYTLRCKIKEKPFEFYKDITDSILKNSEGAYHECKDEGLNRGWFIKSKYRDDKGYKY